MAATSGNTGGGITELAQFIRSQQPLEELIPERNQEDNLQVLDYVNSFLDIVDKELKSPKIYREYVFGNKETFVRSAMMPRIELVASRIIEKKALACSTLSIDDLDFFQQETELFVDLYFLLVTTLIDLVSIRKTDLLSTNSAVDLFLAVKDNLIELAKYEELEDLNNELIARKDQYPEKPLLADRIIDLINTYPITKEDFVFSPVKSVNNYSVGDVIVSLQPGSDIDSVEIGDLPKGVELDQETGEVFVSDANILEPGDYDVVIQTLDEFGGVTTLHLELPIGINDIPRYELAPKKVIQAHSVGDVLARPTLTEYVSEIGRVEWIETDVYPVPPGVDVNSLTGIVSVLDEDLLIIGIHPVRILITSKNGSKSRHEFSLNFKQDSAAIYSNKPKKSIGEFKTGDVLATLSDPNGAILGAQKNTLPDGTVLDATGQLVVGDPNSLRAGTHLFNVISQDSFSVESLQTLFITFDKGHNSFSYDLSNTTPIDDLTNGTIVGILTSATSEVAAKVSLMQGILPRGITLEANGNFVVSNATILEEGNFDLRVRVYVNGYDPSLLVTKKNEIDQLKETIDFRKSDLQAAEDQLQAEFLVLNSIKSNFGFESQKLVNEIAALELALQSATTQTEIAEITNQIALKTEELNALTLSGTASITTSENLIATIEAEIIAITAEIATFEIELDSLERALVILKIRRWIEYDVPVLLTLEEDKPSAWHVEIPKEFDEYENNEIVAQLIDCDGYDNFQLLSGILPAGMDLNTDHGTIEVIDAGQVIAGEFILETRSTDKQSGTTDHRLALIIGGGLSSSNEQYIIRTSKPANNYVNNEILGYPYNPTDTIVSARIALGILPNGTEINTETGALYVAANELLNAGVHDGISIKTTNSSGGSNYHNISLNFGAKTAFTVSTKIAQPITDYITGEFIVKVLTTNGTLQGIQIVEGDLPPGLILNSDAGLIAVHKLNDLVEGDYQFELMMMDLSGASDQQTVDVTIGPGGAKGTVIWNIVTPIDKSKTTNGTLVASPTLLGYTIINAVSTTLPANFALAINGDVTVSNALKLVAGVYSVQIDLTDNAGRNFNEDVVLTVTGGTGGAGGTTNSVVITSNVPTPKDFHLIKDNDILASLNPETDITGVTISSGSIPSGSSLNGLNGRVSVTDRVKLERILTNALMIVQTAGAAAKLATASSSQAQEINVNIEVKAIPKFAIEMECGLFLEAIVTRLEQFEQDNLGDPQVANAIAPFYIKLGNFRDWIISMLSDQTKRQLALGGGYDSFYRKTYLNFGAGVVTEMTKLKDPQVIGALVNLYNEFCVSMLALTLFRQEDISNKSNSPTAVLYANMRSHLTSIVAFADSKFIDENAGMIYDTINPKMANLQIRFSILGPWKLSTK